MLLMTPAKSTDHEPKGQGSPSRENAVPKVPRDLGHSAVLALPNKDNEVNSASKKNEPVQTEEDPAQYQTHHDSRPTRVSSWLRVNISQRLASEDNGKDRGNPKQNRADAKYQDQGGPRVDGC